MDYQIASITEVGTKKAEYEPNGDWCKCLERENCVVLTLADGLGSCASDARAAHTACDRFIEKCASALDHNEVLDEAALIRFCSEIDPVLANRNDKTCFSVVVWYTDTHQVIWFNVGDTRIYKYSRSGAWTQITVDDRAVENKNSNNPTYGTYHTDHGALIPSVGVDCALGDCKLEFHTGSFAFSPGESIVMCSDGMYHSATFFDDTARLLGTIDMEEAIKRIETNDADDHTLLVIRRNMTVDASLDELMAQFEQNPKVLPRHVIIECFYKGLEQMLHNNADANDIAKVSEFMKLHQLYHVRQRIDNLYSDAVKKLKATPQGEEWQRLNAACFDLWDVLQYVFRH